MMHKMYPDWDIEEVNDWRGRWVATRTSYDGAPDSNEPLFLGNSMKEITSQIDEYERN